MAVVLKKMGTLSLVESDLGLTVHHGMTVDVTALSGSGDFDKVDGYFDDLGSAALSGKLYSAGGALLTLSSGSWVTVQEWAERMAA